MFLGQTYRCWCLSRATYYSAGDSLLCVCVCVPFCEKDVLVGFCLVIFFMPSFTSLILSITLKIALSELETLSSCRAQDALSFAPVPYGLMRIASNIVYL